MPELSVLIVTYNNESDIEACLDSVAAIEGLDVETVVVDNGSSDGTLAAARRHPLGVEVIDAGDNLGFGRGMNMAAAATSGALLLLLNPDAVLAPGAAERLVGLARRRPGAAMYGGLTEYTDGTLNANTVRRLPGVRSTLMFATGLSILSQRIPDFEATPLPNDDAVRPVQMLTGSLMLIPRPVWDRLGGFDEHFFMYAEDTDLFARIAEEGLEILLDPAARIIHDGGASTPDTGRKTVMMMAGRSTYVRLRWPGVRGRLGLAALWTGVAVRALAGRVHPRARRWRTAWAMRDWWLPGYGDGRRLPPST